MTERNLSDVLDEKRLSVMRELQEERDRLTIQKPEGWVETFIFLGEQYKALLEAESLEIDESISVVAEALVGLMVSLPDGERQARIAQELSEIDTLKGDIG